MVSLQAAIAAIALSGVGQTAMLDFYADWCAPCRHMDQTTFHDRSIIEAAAKDFIMIRVDFSQRGDRARERVARSYDILGIPSVVFLKRGGEERIDLRVMDLMAPEEFMERMTRLRNGDGPADTK